MQEVRGSNPLAPPQFKDIFSNTKPVTDAALEGHLRGSSALQPAD
jgi:hypothetical protein